MCSSRPTVAVERWSDGAVRQRLRAVQVEIDRLEIILPLPADHAAAVLQRWQ